MSAYKAAAAELVQAESGLQALLESRGKQQQAAADLRRQIAHILTHNSS